MLASVEDARDVRAWSGTPFHLAASLRAAGADVVLAGPLGERFGLPLKVLQRLRNSVAPGTWSRLREPVVLDGYARQVERAISATSPDVVLAPGTLPVARLRTDVPVVTYTDATFAGLVDFYADYTGLSRRYLRMGHAMERSALERVSLAVYSSAWAARSAVADYGLPPDKVAVVPFGANVADPGPLADRRDDGCRLLLVGRGWERKGADLAVATTARLRSLGVPATLDVVGCRPPSVVAVPGFVTVHGSLEKDDPQAAARLAELYASAAFFLLPTRADCTPVVLAEAQAHGVPVITADVGGTASMLAPGRSGWVLPPAEFVDAAAARIAGAWARPAEHAALRQGAREFYTSTLNWPSAAQALLTLLRERVVGTPIASA
nr:glycosyltransferase family 4 protein [Petropleomorpha daqingensis]